MPCSEILLIHGHVILLPICLGTLPSLAVCSLSDVRSTRIVRKGEQMEENPMAL